MALREDVRTHAGVGLYVAPSMLEGRGVFTSRRIAHGEVLETCPVLVIPAEEAHVLEHEGTSLAGYWFEWVDGAGAIALGFGSLYNHSWRPNARYDHDYERGVVIYTALRDIEPGEELTINYSGEPNGHTDLWF